MLVSLGSPTSDELLEQYLREAEQCHCVAAAYVYCQRNILPTRLSVPPAYIRVARELHASVLEAGTPILSNRCLGWRIDGHAMLFLLLHGDDCPPEDWAILEVLAEELSQTLVGLRPASEMQRAFPVAVLESSHLDLHGLAQVIAAYPMGAVFVYDEDFRYHLVAGEEVERLGLAPGELVGKTLGEAFGDLAEHLAPHYRAALAGEEYLEELEFPHGAFLLRYAPVRAPDGTIVAGMTYAQNITAAYRTRQELEVARHLLEVHHRCSGAGAFLVDAVSQRRQWDQRMYAITGRPVAEGPASTEVFLSRVHAEDLPKVSLAFDTLRSGAHQTETEFRFETFDGREVTLHAHLVSEANEAGELRRWCGALWPVEENADAAYEVTVALQTQLAEALARAERAEAELRRLIDPSLPVSEDLL